MLELQPITFREACRFVERYHRHHKPPRGQKFSVAVNDGEKIVGVSIAGRPVARHADDGWTLEVTRVCTLSVPNVASMLYGAMARAGKALGYRRVISYTLDTETGTSLQAAGWVYVRATAGGSWSRPSRPRVDTAPTGQKMLWEAP